MASVVSISAAIEAAFCSAVRVTLVGSMTPAFDQVFVLAGRGVVAEVGVRRWRGPSRRRWRLRRRRCRRSGAAALRRRGVTMLTPICSSPSHLQAVQRLGGAQQGHAAAGNDAFFDRRAGGVQGVFDAGLLFLHLGLGRRADLDHRHAAGQLGQPLLQLLAVVVRGGLFDLGADLLDAAFDRPSARRRLRRSWCCPCRR